MKRTALAVTATTLLAVAAAPALAGQISLTIDGSDAIYLAGRTDVTIPELGNNPASFLARHSSVSSDFVRETFPSSIAVTQGDTIRVLDPAIGGIHFFNGSGTPFGPEGNTGSYSSLNSFGGISAYNGPQGSLVGVFLDDSVPSSSPPSALTFNNASALNFTTLSPGLRQVFFVGNGATSGGVMQQFVAPTGATRLFFGLADGYSFTGKPGYYEDNDGSYQIRVGINEIPVVPLPTSVASGLGLLGFAAVLRVRARRRTNAL